MNTVDQAYSNGHSVGLRVRQGDTTGIWRDNPYSRTDERWAAWQRGFNAATPSARIATTCAA